MKTKSTLTKLLSALVLAAILSVCAATSAQAGPELHLSGMFGVAEGQVARINAVNLGGPDTRPIQIEMQFIDAMGNVVARDTETIAAGQATFFDFAAFVIEGNRVQLRVLVGMVDPPEPDKNLKITIEVFDADTGKTTFFVDPWLRQG